jgi:hypothetical protein
MPHDCFVSDQTYPVHLPRMAGRRIAARLGLDALWAAVMLGVALVSVGGGILLGESLDRVVASRIDGGGARRWRPSSAP